MELQAIPQLFGIDEEMEEVVLRVSKSRNESLALIVGRHLFQLVRTKNSKKDPRPSTIHSLCLKRDSIEGFIHNRYDIIRTFRWPLLLICILSFITSSLISITWTAPFEIGIALFLISGGLLIFRLAKPHQLVFITNNSKQSLFFFGLNSKRTEMVMKEIDRMMALFLVSGNIDIGQINVNVAGNVITGSVHDSVLMNDLVPMESNIPSVNEILNEPEEYSGKRRG